jgi:hypothetical protein
MAKGAINRALRPWIPAYASDLKTKPGRLRGANITTSIAAHHSLPEKHIFQRDSP